MGKIEITTVNTFDLEWNDKKSGGDYDGAFYKPIKLPIGFNAIGSYGQGNYGAPSGSVVVVKEIEPGALALPVDYKQVYNDRKSGASMDGSFWLPVPPEGYTAMGLVCVEGYNKPDLDDVVCLRSDLVAPATSGNMIWIDKGTGAAMDGGFWNVNASPGCIQTGVFCGASSHSAANALPLFGIRSDAL